MRARGAMPGRIGIFAIFLAVAALHLWVIRMQIDRPATVVRPEAKIRHITLTHVAVAKPPPPVIPPSPQIRPVEPPDPKPPMPKPKTEPKAKPIHRKETKRPRRKPHAKEAKKPPRAVHHKPVPPVTHAAKAAIAPQRPAESATLRDHYIALIRRKIKESLYYPRMARRMHLQGDVRVAFTVHGDGQVEAVRVIAAPREILARAAARTIRRLHLPPIPQGLGLKRMEITVPITFRLKG